MSVTNTTKMKTDLNNISEIILVASFSLSLLLPFFFLALSASQPNYFDIVALSKMYAPYPALACISYVLYKATE